ncbi:MAG: xanthine dehydrogenase family protein [Rhodospirillaceae bacterium]|nr:xanthine dehydrogenase family protein [Rhodospirillaceae bacterium]MYH35172.1 xanthine dehydrogenase family protein [Rhodospirillaceae bacterium]MYK59501.1 xanthine dehydrogenase family protein [Rhodospirillaceae bacterium]
MTKFGVGQAAARIEDRVLVTGAGAYTDDTSIDGQAWACVLRSPHAHARILGIDSAEAAAAPGVVGILTGADMAADGLGDLPCLVPLENRDGSERHNSPHGILAGDRVRYVGHPVALVVAETLAQARDAAERIAVEYEELPVTVHTEHSAADGAPLLYDHIPNNLIYDWHKGDEAGVEAALARAHHVCELRLVNNRVVANPMEPRSALAVHDAAAGRTTLAASTQGPSLIRDILAEPVFGIDPSNLRVTTGHVGGGFGMKVFPHAEQALVVWAARRLGRPVKWTSERSEGFLSDVQARDNITYCKLGLDRNGRILALRADTFANEGAYLSTFAPLVACFGMDMLAGLYDIPVIYTTVKGVLTNTVPVDAYRGAGRPEAAYVVERVIDKAARETGRPPDEIRRINFIRPDRMPYTTCLGDTYDSGEFEALMDQAMAQADWAGFEARRAESLRRGKYRGVGLATYIERCGGGPPEVAAGSFGDDGILTVAIGTMDNGQGHKTSYSQILSGELGIDMENIRIFQGDSDRAPPGMTGGSRSVPVGGSAMLGLAAAIVDKGRRTAADMLEAAAGDVEYGDGAYRVAGTDREVGLFDVARRAQENGEPLDESFERTPEADTFPNGAHVVELEVDAETAEIEILRYTVVDDFGAVINPLLIEGQVHGGIVQGLGQALHEFTWYDPASGQLETGSFMDYNMPKADYFPFFSFATRNVRCTTNPLGIKGAGEAGAIGAPPAAINALVDALRPATGIDHIDMPATPQAVFRLLNGARKAA